jgi:hypothetical protein
MIAIFSGLVEVNICIGQGLETIYILTKYCSDVLELRLCRQHANVIYLYLLEILFQNRID